MNPWLVIYKGAWVLLVVLATVGLTCLFVPRCHGIRELQRRKSALESENAEIRESIEELQRKRERFATDPAFVEHTARESGMVKPDETMFKFTNAAPARAVRENE